MRKCVLGVRLTNQVKECRVTQIVRWVGLVILCWSASFAQAKTLYVDNTLAKNCQGNYSVKSRGPSGQDGDAYRTIVEAANVAKAGDTVFIREGVYHCDKSVTENDVLWPKNSGSADKPIVFRAFTGEKVALGEGPTGYPDTEQTELSIANCVVTLKGVGHISIEDLQFRKVGGWVFARNCDHIIFRNCVFEDALHAAKGTARFIECRDCRFINCSFRNSSYDSMVLEKCERSLVEDCTFVSAVHSLLAIRGSSFNVIRNCQFRNPFFRKQRAEKLVEVYDVKLDRRNPANPSYEPLPAYNSTKHNLFEYNFFGYHPFRPKRAGQPSAMQYSGQSGIIRRNIYSNPPLKSPDPDFPDGVAGGIGIIMRWGGSWDGWKAKKDGTGGRWWGEANEAGYVTHNRIYNNVFCGYDNGCITIPREDAMDKALNPPPLYETNPSKQYEEKFAFKDNLFLNNIVVPGRYEFRVNWAWQKMLTGKPVAVIMFGFLKEVSFRNNDFHAPGKGADDLIYVHAEKSGQHWIESVGPPSHFETVYPQTFVGNLQKDPLFVDPDVKDYSLQEQSPLIDAGAFLTVTAGAGTATKEMLVKDTSSFYDGFGIEGEQGDVIQLEGQKETVRVVRADHEKNMLTLDRPLSWKEGQGVGLAYSGNGPDVGTFEKGQRIVIGPRTGSNPGR